MKKNLVAFVLLPLVAVLASCGNTYSVAVTSSAASSEVAASSEAASSEAVSSEQTTSKTSINQGGHASDAVKNYDLKNQMSEPVSITLWSTTGKAYQTQLNKYIEDFKQIEPNVTITSTIVSGSYSTLESNTIAGFSTANYPDMVQCYPDHVVEYLDYGKAVDLDTYLNDSTIGLTEEDKADYLETFMKEGQEYPVSGTYSVPWDKSTEFMYYNQDVLLGLNLSAVDPAINNGEPLTQAYLEDLTWEELFGHLCPALKKYNETVKPILATGDAKKAGQTIFTYDSDDNLFITLAEQYGYDYTKLDMTTGKGEILFNNANMKSLLKTFSKAKADGYIQTKGSNNAYTSDLFTTNNALFTVSSSAGANYNFVDTNPMNVGVARIPHAEGKGHIAINQGPSLAVLDHGDANRAKASYLFWRFMTSKENALAWALNTDYMGVRHSVYVNDEYLDAGDVTLAGEKTYDRLKALNISYIGKSQNTENFYELFTSPVFKGSSAARSQASSLMTWALNEDPAKYDSEVDAKFENAVNEVNKAMA